MKANGMTGRIRIIIFFAFMIFEMQVSAQTATVHTTLPFGPSATLDDYLAYAALNNPGLEAAFNNWKAAIEQMPQARALPDPRFNYAYFIESVETRVGPQRQKFGISQAFPWFGKLNLKEGIAAEAAAAQQALYEKTRQALFNQVKQAYYEYYLLGQTIGITRKHIELVTRLEAVARTRYKTSAAPYSSVINAQVELGKLNDQFNTQLEMQVPAQAKLNAIMGLPADNPLPWPEAIPFYELDVSDEQLIEWLIDSNPELQQLNSLTRKESKTIQLAHKANWPDIMLGVDYIDTGEARMPDTPDSGKDPLIAMASINLPIWYGKNKAAAKEALFKKQGLEEQQKDTLNRLITDLKMSRYQFNNANRKIDLYRDTLLPKAEQSLQVTRQDFETGKASFTAVIDAQRVLLEFQLAYQQSLTDHAKYLARIERLISRDIDDHQATPEKQEN